MTPKSSVLLADGLLVVALSGLFLLAQPGPQAPQGVTFDEVSPEAAESLRLKIVDIITADGEFVRINHPGRSRRPDASTAQSYRIKERLMERAGGGGDFNGPHEDVIRWPVVTSLIIS